jgi:ribosomal protein S18 acetylase RimI-like enzyme
MDSIYGKCTQYAEDNEYGWVMKAAKEEQVDALYEIETEAFPADEAADLDGIRMRVAKANEFYQVITDENGKNIVGFVNGTLCHGRELHHDSMSEHISSGKTLVIHSVTIAKEYRRKGWATKMLNLYVERLRNGTIANKKVEYILLIAKAYLLEFYVNCGFHVRRLSPVIHGKDRWYELAYDVQQSRSPAKVPLCFFIPTLMLALNTVYRSRSC